jgi:hypothetical protein
VCSSKGEALQLTSGLDYLSIQAYRLWMEYPSRGKMNLFISGFNATPITFLVADLIERRLALIRADQDVGGSGKIISAPRPVEISLVRSAPL